MKLKNIIYTIISIVFPVSIFSQKYVPDTASFNQTDKLLTQETFVTTFSFQTTNSGTSYDLDSSLNFMYIKDSILTLQISDLGGNSALGFEGKINDFTVKKTDKRKKKYHEVQIVSKNDSLEIDIFLWVNINRKCYAIVKGTKFSHTITYHGELFAIGDVVIFKRHLLFR